MSDFPAALPLVAHWLSLWLGLYLVARRPRTAADLLAGGAVVCMSTYLLCAALLFTGPARAEAVFWMKALGGLSVFAPVLFMHAMMRLVDWRSRLQWALLRGAYALAVVTALLRLSDTLVYGYWGPQAAGGQEGFPGGPLYPLLAIELVAPLLIAVVALLRAWPAQRDKGLGREFDVIIAGAAVMLGGSCLLLANALADSSIPEGALQPPLLVGAALVVVPLARYRGLAEGQLLRRDLASSLLGAVLLMTGFVVLVHGAGEPLVVVALIGWLVLTAFVFVDDLRGLADRVVFGAGTRAGRDSLRTAAVYAGSLESLDLSSLSPEQHATLVDLLGQVDRAGVASTRFAGGHDPRLALLAVDAFAAVRAALGLSPDWVSGDGIARAEVRRRVVGLLRRRERQVLGLKYLGYGDKQMASLIGVKVGVPRSYLSDAKRRLGLSAGAPLMLFVHFAGLVQEDALPLLRPPGTRKAEPMPRDVAAAPEVEMKNMDAASPQAAPVRPERTPPELATDEPARAEGFS